MSNDIGIVRKRLEEYKKEFSGEGMDRDVIMFRDRASQIRKKHELDTTPEPPSIESIIAEMHERNRPRKRSD